MNSPDKAVEGLKEEDGPSLMENPDLHLPRNEHQRRGNSYDHKSEDMNDGVQAYLDQHSSPVVHVGSENDGQQSPTVKSNKQGSSSPDKRYEHYSAMERRTSDYDTEERRLSTEDHQIYHKKGRDEDDHIAHPGNILDNNDHENFNNEFQSEDSYSLPHNSILTGDNNNSYEIMGDEAFTRQTAKSPRQNEPGNEVVEDDSAKFHPEKTELDVEKDGETMSSRTEMKEPDYTSVIAPSEKDGMVWEKSSLHSPQRTQNASQSPERHFSISAERAPPTQPSPPIHLSPRKEGSPSSAYIDRRSASPPIPSKRKRSPSPERHSGGHKRTSSRDRSPPARQRSPPERSTQRNHHHRDGSPRRHIAPSPRRRDSPRRRGRSPSRSPVRRRGSPGRRRDHHRRSRSRSPHARDRHRRSPRRRPSPRRRSPAPSYSRRRSPRRPWSPPSNRNTGLGKPGNNLFVAGFSYVTTERDLEKKFSRFGRVTDVRIVRDKGSGESRGFGFLSLERDEDADAAIRAVDQTEWNGRIVLVEKSKTSTR